MGRVQYDTGAALPKQSPARGGNAPTGSPATAKYVQSFEEVATQTEQPSKAAPWVTRGNPKRDPIPDGQHEPNLLVVLDDRVNIRADGKVLVRETPDSKKSDKDSRPNGLRVYRQQAGEDIP